MLFLNGVVKSCSFNNILCCTKTIATIYKKKSTPGQFQYPIVHPIENMFGIRHWHVVTFQRMMSKDSKIAWGWFFFWSSCDRAYCLVIIFLAYVGLPLCPIVSHIFWRQLLHGWCPVWVALYPKVQPDTHDNT